MIPYSTAVAPSSSVQKFLSDVSMGFSECLKVCGPLGSVDDFEGEATSVPNRMSLVLTSEPYCVATRGLRFCNSPGVQLTQPVNLFRPCCGKSAQSSSGTVNILLRGVNFRVHFPMNFCFAKNSL